MFLNPSSKAFRINFRKSLKAKSLFCSKDVLSNASLEKEAPKETLPHNLSFIKPFQKLRNYHNTNLFASPEILCAYIKIGYMGGLGNILTGKHLALRQPIVFQEIHQIPVKTAEKNRIEDKKRFTKKTLSSYINQKFSSLFGKREEGKETVSGLFLVQASSHSLNHTGYALVKPQRGNISNANL
ncbi:hypothetical protein CDAR_263391 [Caerostris darwini]|uniref:Uncharacterized protein n=1 Tax=Caerostris darwini TaxID=1538125 RepID=A0AAV4RZD6_9ARAC|nr:hypothetical protein CDAR_263391 [Caerostris darwini]